MTPSPNTLLRFLLNRGWEDDIAMDAVNAYKNGSVGSLVRVGITMLPVNDCKHDYSHEMIIDVLNWEKSQ